MVVSATYKIGGESKRKYVTLFVNGVHTHLQLDRWRKFGQPPLLSTHRTARNASGEALKLADEATCEVTFGDNRIGTCCFVTDHPGLHLLGVDWMDDLKLLDQPVNSICNQMKIHSRSETPPNCSTQGGTSPAESMVRRKIRTRFDNVRPSPLTSPNEVHSASYAQCNSVLARDFRGQDKWTAGVISKRNGKVIYIWKRHINQPLRNPGSFPIKPNPALLHWDILLDIFELEQKADMPLSNIGKITSISSLQRRSKRTGKPMNPLQMNPRFQSYDTCRKMGFRTGHHQDNLIRSSVTADEIVHQPNT
ncbi:uncharacterized protein DEA37_0012493 [Paragonimus westermani]|uniref:Uncharacterized protein n=1 Tax=Paragonimus westermani TaxID=34504 RepID=A0A5J4NDW3_9TREM|nr:uncharacterized protein DEA37_0012493 [Paragonimus westermani]